MGNAQRYVIFTYIIVAILLAVTLERLLGSLAFQASLPNPGLIGNNVALSDLLGWAISGGAAFWAYRNPRIHEYCVDVVSELRKVTWPSRKETQTATLVVIIASLLAALVLGSFDQLWGVLTGLLYHRA